MRTSRSNLQALAVRYGVELSYHGIDGREHVASEESLAVVVRVLSRTEVIPTPCVSFRRKPESTGQAKVGIHNPLEKLDSGFRRNDECNKEKIWGVFVPLYSLRSSRNWGTGDFSDLENLVKWVAKIGGRVVATLPLLPTFIENRFFPSPYSPVSRLFWNEFYIDPSSLPEFEGCEYAEIKKPGCTEFIDYRSVMRCKRQILESLCKKIKDDRKLSSAFEDYVSRHRWLADYARFRAYDETHQGSWHKWKGAARDGEIAEGDCDPSRVAYHQYAQWCAYRQMLSLEETCKKAGVSLYLDFSLGVHPDGYDAWRYRNLFAWGLSAGAPPDAYFPDGQDWGFPPLRPDAMRSKDGHDYFAAALSHQMSVADMLRIDHVMGLHRLFLIPVGGKPSDGVYVKYPADELYTVISLESARHKAVIVGEDLGLVPDYVRPAMKQHGFYRTVLPMYEDMKDIPREAVVCLGTHDMPPFAAVTKGKDIQADLLAQVRKMGESGAGIAIVNLEDCWLETERQNVPGTFLEHPNWQRKGRLAFEEFSQDKMVLKILEHMNEARKK